MYPITVGGRIFTSIILVLGLGVVAVPTGLLASALSKARELAAIGFKITSGYRSPAHNEKVGGVPSSSHTVGRAVDIYAPTSTQKYLIINSLLQAGFNRIGVAKNFIHVDDDPSKSEDVIWTY